MNQPLRKQAKQRLGYTLLELMLALALLGALMSVAWAVMGTYRDAEERGWKLSHRTQVIRTAREWLQVDLQQLVGSDTRPNSNGTPVPSRSIFVGNAMGFTATIVPPLEPLPFFERLMSQSLSEDAVQGSRSDATDGPLAARPRTEYESGQNDTDTRQSPWPHDRIVVQYELIPVTASRSQIGNINTENTNASDSEPQFVLVRRERIEAVASAGSEFTGNQQIATGNSAADRLLTGQDLYRTSDERQASDGAILRESKLTGITNVGFKYCDGMAWLDSWDAESAGQLPTAVALGFDFPATSNMQRTDEFLGRNIADEFETNRQDEISFADSALATQPTAEVSSASELGIVQGSLSEVQIVVFVDAQMLAPAVSNEQHVSRGER